MLSCREVSRLVASEGLLETSRMRRLEARLHSLMCRHCRRYQQELRAIANALRERWGG